MDVVVCLCYWRMFAFVALRLVSLVPSQEIGREERTEMIYFELRLYVPFDTINQPY